MHFIRRWRRPPSLSRVNFAATTSRRSSSRAGELLCSFSNTTAATRSLGGWSPRTAGLPLPWCSTNWGKHSVMVLLRPSSVRVAQRMLARTVNTTIQTVKPWTQLFLPSTQRKSAHQEAGSGRQEDHEVPSPLPPQVGPDTCSPTLTLNQTGAHTHAHKRTQHQPYCSHIDPQWLVHRVQNPTEPLRHKAGRWCCPSPTLPGLSMPSLSIIFPQHTGPSHSICPLPTPILVSPSGHCVLIAVWYCFAVYAKPVDGP